MTYSFYPHKGTLAESDVLEQAVSLNLPLLTAQKAGEEGAAEFERFSLVETDCPHVLVDTVKRSEDGRFCVVRLYEYENSTGNAALRFPWPVKKAVETNLCEEGESPVSVEGNTITVPMGCFEIKTLKIDF